MDLHLEYEAAPGEKPHGRDQARLTHLSSHQWRSARVAWAAPRLGAAAPSRRPPSTPKRVAMSRRKLVAPRRRERAPRRPRPRTTGSGPTILGPHRRLEAGTGSGRTPSPQMPRVRATSRRPWLQPAIASPCLKTGAGRRAAPPSRRSLAIIHLVLGRTRFSSRPGALLLVLHLWKVKRRRAPTT